MEKMEDYCLQNNHLIRVWMLGSFTKQRGRGGEEVKYKGHKSRRYLLEWPALKRGCAHFFFSAGLNRWAAVSGMKEL